MIVSLRDLVVIIHCYDIGKIETSTCDILRQQPLTCRTVDVRKVGAWILILKGIPWVS